MNLVLQVICAMLRAHLSLADITAAPAHQLLRVESVPDARVQVAPSLSAEVRLAALVTNIVGVALHGESSWVVVPPRSLSAHRLALGQALVLEPHESLLSHIFMQGLGQENLWICLKTKCNVGMRTTRKYTKCFLFHFISFFSSF